MTPRLGAGLVAAATMLGLAGCAGPAARLATPAVKPCAYAACGMDALSLAKVTAADLQAPLDAVIIGDIQPQFNGAVLVWRATARGHAYLCREGRDADEVHYVDCRRARPAAPQAASLKAFP